jgi:hypothetical protein
LFLQDIIDMRTERRRKGVYGPRPGVLNVVFVDDLNLPEKEKFFAQPPVEALRQLLANGGARAVERVSLCCGIGDVLGGACNRMASCKHASAYSTCGVQPFFSLPLSVIPVPRLYDAVAVAVASPRLV